MCDLFLGVNESKMDIDIDFGVFSQSNDWIQDTLSVCVLWVGKYLCTQTHKLWTCFIDGVDVAAEHKEQ